MPQPTTASPEASSARRPCLSTSVAAGTLPTSLARPKAATTYPYSACAASVLGVGSVLRVAQLWVLVGTGTGMGMGMGRGRGMGRGMGKGIT